MPLPRNTPTVSIVIPTFHRNNGLRVAVSSILQLEDKAMAHAELIIVDNSPERDAELTVAELADNAPIPVIYVSETSPGVANARNTGLDAAHARLIAFLDDDETARQGWLDQLLTTHEMFGAAVTFGPVATVLPTGHTRHQAYFERFFARTGPDTSGEMDHFFGCGNALLDLDQIQPCLPEGSAYFNPLSNETGGEDDYLFSLVKRAGGRFAWAAHACVDEHVPAHRARLGYTLRRAFGYGQGPSTICWRKSPPNIAGLLMWMTIGAGQACIYGLTAIFLWAIRSPKRANMLDKSVRGLGKLFWFPPFSMKFYGASMTSVLRNASAS